MNSSGTRRCLIIIAIGETTFFLTKNYEIQNSRNSLESDHRFPLGSQSGQIFKEISLEGQFSPR